MFQRQFAVAVFSFGFVFCALTTTAKSFETDVGAQYRPRLEFRDPPNNATGDVFASHRARLKFKLSHGDWGVQIDPQHTLLWGTAASTLSGISGNLDFHQAYAFGKVTDSVLVAIGRQELTFDDQRLLGPVDWTQQARTFDAARISTTYPDLKLETNLFAALLSENAPRNETLFGIRVGLKRDRIHASIMTLAEQAKKRVTGDRNFYRATPGANVAILIDKLRIDISGYAQFGGFTTGATDVDYRAWMAATKVAYADRDTIGEVHVAADILSGDKDTADNTRKSFDTLFATNHKYYGHMDFFLNLPLHTGQLGLIDVYGGWQKPVVEDLIGYLTVHYFLAQQATAADNRGFGTEIDAGVAYKIQEHVGFNGGYSLFLPDRAFVDIGRAAPDDTHAHWLWAQLDVNF